MLEISTKWFVNVPLYFKITDFNLDIAKSYLHIFVNAQGS